MTSWLRALADLLVADSSGHRAIEETFADWREERAVTASAIRRIWTDVRGIAAVGRVLALSGGRGVVRADSWRPIGVSLLVSVACAPVLLIGSYFLRPYVPPIALAAYLAATGSALLMGPICAIGLSERPDRHIDVFGSVIVCGLVMLLINGWIFPLASQAVRQGVYLSFGGGGRPLIAPGPNELTLPKLIGAARTAPSYSYAYALALTTRLGFVLAGPTGLLLGVAIRRRLERRLPWRAIQGFAALSAIVAILIALVLVSFARRSDLYQTVSYVIMVRLWVSLVIAWLATAALIRAARPAAARS